MIAYSVTDLTDWGYVKEIGKAYIKDNFLFIGSGVASFLS